MIDQASNAAEREERLHEILLAYVEETDAGRAPERRQFMAAHADLRQELEEFFTSHDALERLAGPLRAVARDYSSEVATGDADAELGRLGDFRLLREVGRGGMGVVYEAEQISLRRRV